MIDRKSSAYEMAYADARWGVGSVAVTKSTLLGAAVHSGLGLNTTDLEAEEELNGVLKITQRAMVERRSYWSLSMSLAPSVCLSLSLSHTHTSEASAHFENKAWELYLYNEELWFFLHISSFITVYNMLTCRFVFVLRLANKIIRLLT